MSETESETEYLKSLNDRELKAYYIAKDHLGMSFNMQLSNGYRDWIKERAKAAETPANKVLRS